jgi:hypothetical protein
MGVFDIRQDEQMTSYLLQHALPHSRICVASPYLNLAKHYKNLILSTKGHIDIVTASPEVRWRLYLIVDLLRLTDSLQRRIYLGLYHLHIHLLSTTSSRPSPKHNKKSMSMFLSMRARDGRTTEKVCGISSQVIPNLL